MIEKRVNILVLRGGALGDFILTLPALRALRARWPDAWIELLGYPHIANLALAAGLVDRVDSLDRADVARLFSWRPQLGAEQVAHIRSFDVILSYLHDPTGVVRQNLEEAGAHQVICGSPLVTEGHAADFLMRPLEALAIYPEGETEPRLGLRGTEQEIAARAWLASHGPAARAWAIHPGSGGEAKTWPAERFADLGRHLAGRPGYSAVFLIGEADGTAERVLVRETPEIPLFRGRSLLEVAGLLSCVEGFVGNDSGITHLAAALGTPTVGLFGPTDPERWGPRGSHVRVVHSPTGSMDGIDLEHVLSFIPEPRAD